MKISPHANITNVIWLSMQLSWQLLDGNIHRLLIYSHDNQPQVTTSVVGAEWAPTELDRQPVSDMNHHLTRSIVFFLLTISLSEINEHSDLH